MFFKVVLFLPCSDLKETWQRTQEWTSPCRQPRWSQMVDKSLPYHHPLAVTGLIVLLILRRRGLQHWLGVHMSEPAHGNRLNDYKLLVIIPHSVTTWLSQHGKNNSSSSFASFPWNWVWAFQSDHTISALPTFPTWTKRIFCYCIVAVWKLLTTLAAAFLKYFHIQLSTEQGFCVLGKNCVIFPSVFSWLEIRLQGQCQLYLEVRKSVKGENYSGDENGKHGEEPHHLQLVK